MSLTKMIASHPDVKGDVNDAFVTAARQPSKNASTPGHPSTARVS